jgi:Calcineurin-like phosphoesterase
MFTNARFVPKVSIPYIIIGDVHSRATALSRALVDNPNAQIIFIGDILDGRHWEQGVPEALKTLEDLATLIQVIACLQAGAKLIAGNHDVKLTFDDDSKGQSAKTKARLSSYELYAKFIGQVKQADTYLQIDSGSLTYHLAHAVPFASATKTEQVFGNKVEGQRVKWFEQTKTWPSNVVKVCGHYHEIIVEPNFVVLDGDTKTDNCLPVLLIENGKHTLKTYVND